MSYLHLALLSVWLPIAAGCGEQGAETRLGADSLVSEDGIPVTSEINSPDTVPVTVAGRVIDEETGAGVPGGYVIVLAPGVSFEDWEMSSDEEVEELMAGAAVTDSMGRYEVADLPRGLDFTVVVAARGHTPAIFESGLSVRADDPPLTRIADVRLEPR